MTSGPPFEESSFPTLLQTESGYWWFKARARLILWTLKSKVKPIQNLVEVGCGTGYILSQIEAAFPQLTTTGTEYFQSSVILANNRLRRTEVSHLDARCMRQHNIYEVIGCFDVLEHIPEDSDVLLNFYNALIPGGYLLITVPQHQWLWSPSDDYAHHVRRYSKPQLNCMIQSAGFKLVYTTSFVSLLLPLMIVQRYLSRHKQYVPENEFKIHPLLNIIFSLVMHLELVLIRLGAHFPVGGSRLILAAK